MATNHIQLTEEEKHDLAQEGQESERDEQDYIWGENTPIAGRVFEGNLWAENAQDGLSNKNSRSSKRNSESAGDDQDALELDANDILINDQNSNGDNSDRDINQDDHLNPDQELENNEKRGKIEFDLEEEEEEEEKFENAVEAKDFNYFKQQCKFEKFVNQLGTSSNKSKDQSLLFNYFGDAQQQWGDEDENSGSDKPMPGFDTRYTYTRDGIMVYDINANVLIDEAEDSLKGISKQDYNVFRNAAPANEYDKNMGYDYYQKFKSYRNALAPFAGLEFASDHERKIYEFLPPFKKKKVHLKIRDLRVPNTPNIIFFNSEFESGNLHRATRISDFEYNIQLEYDKNSRNYTQWYYFSWRNIK